MKVLIGLVLLVSSVSAVQQSSVTKDGITFTFDGSYETGTYATGDYWVVGPVTITAITPDFDGTYNGWEVNPDSNALQSFDTRSPMGSFVSPPALPYTAGAGESVVKVDSWEERDSDCQCDAQDVGPSGSYSHAACVWAAAVLTVVDAVPPDNGATVFRPPYYGDDKPEYRTTQLLTDRLPSLNSSLVSPALVPALSTVTERYSRVFIDHGYRAPGYSLLPADWTSEYGGHVGANVGDAVLRVLLDDPLQDKMPAVVGLVQRGIDLYAMYQDGNSWPGAGGWGNGRKLPMMFAAALLDDAEMENAARSAAEAVYYSPTTPESFHPFHEDNMVSYSTRAGQVLFGQSWNSADETRYWQNQAGGGSSRDIIDPYGYIDGGEVPGGTYQLCCNSATWRAPALACLLMPEVKDLWNNDHFIDYVDRWVTQGTWSAPDPCAPAVEMGSKTAFLENGVDSGYTVTWGPDPANPGDCIRDSDSSDGIGRFPHLHGTNANGGGYSTDFVTAMWAAFRDSAMTSGIGRAPVTQSGAGMGISVFPNPVRGAAVITAEGPVGIYDADGRMVYSTGAVRAQHVEPLRRIWNGLDIAGHPVPDGMYFIRSGNAVTRIMVIR